MSVTEKSERIAEKAGTTHKTIEKATVGAYKATETGAVGGFSRVSDKLIEKLFTRGGESVKETKKCLAILAEKPKTRSKDINKKAKSHKY